MLSNVSNWSKELLVKEKTTKRILSLQFHTQIPMSEITRSTIKAPLSFLRFSSKKSSSSSSGPVVGRLLGKPPLSLSLSRQSRFVSFRFVSTQGERRKGQKCRFFAVKFKKKKKRVKKLNRRRRKPDETETRRRRRRLFFFFQVFCV